MLMTPKDIMSNNRPTSLSYGQSENQIKQYRAEKQLFDQRAAMEFLQTILSLPLPIEAPHSALRDGVLLCRLLNQIKPGTVKQISKSPTPFSKMSNVYNFLNGATKLGLEDADLFETVDLYEGKDMAKVYSTILAVARKLCFLSFPTRSSSDREKDLTPRPSPITDEKIFRSSLFPGTSLLSPQDCEKIDAIKANADLNSTPNEPKSPKNLYTSPTSNILYPKSPTQLNTSTGLLNNNLYFKSPTQLDISTGPQHNMYFKSPITNKIDSPVYSFNPPIRVPNRRPVTHYASMDSSAVPAISETSKLVAPRLPPSSDKNVSDKIKNLRLFFDNGDKRLSPPKAATSEGVTPKISLLKEKERPSSSPDLKRSIGLIPSFSAPVNPTHASSNNSQSTSEILHEHASNSNTHIGGNFVSGSTTYETKSNIYSFDATQVPTAEDRVKKPAHFRVGKGGIIEDLDLSIKKAPAEQSRGDLLRLDNIDWGVDSDDSDLESDIQSQAPSSQFNSISQRTIDGSRKYKSELSTSPTLYYESPTSNHQNEFSDNRLDSLKKDQLALRKQHSRNYSEKPIPSQLDSLPVARPRAGSAGLGEYARDRLSLFYENSRLLSHYQLGDCIGKGQFGSVYKALNLQTGQIVAVKRIELDGRSEEETISLMGEVDLLKSLSHVRIVHYEGCVQSEHYLNIILEYVENGSLLSLLRSYGTFSETLVASYTSQILEGLIYLHDRQVVHCDLKAANILTTKNGKVKLTDFGVSLNLQINESDIGEIAAGTPYWMAPEVITLQGASTASDIWSVACTIVELLTGKPPYHELNKHAALYRIVEEECPPIPKNLSKNLENFLRLCFNKKPTKRPTADRLSCHEWIIESQLNNEVAAKLKVSSRENFVEEEQRASLITNSLWESCYTFSEVSLLSPPVTDIPIRFPEQQSSSSAQHNFIKSTFEKPILCRVCNDYAKRQALMCHECKMICHIGCAEYSNLSCVSESERPAADSSKMLPIYNQNLRRTFYSDGANRSRHHGEASHSPSSSSTAIPWTTRQRIIQKKKKHNDDCCIS